MWVGEVGVEGGHFVLADGILEGREGGLFGLGGGEGRGEVEDCLGEGEGRVGEVLGFAHGGCVCCCSRVKRGGGGSEDGNRSVCEIVNESRVFADLPSELQVRSGPRKLW